MGEALAPHTLRSFGFELTKMADNKEPFFSGLHYLLGRVTRPLEGWRMMSPTEALRSAPSSSRLLKGLREGIINTGLAEARKGTESAQLLDPLRRTFGAGTHLAPGHTPGQGLRGLAERASRAGWTGESKATKYLPIGEKAQSVLGGSVALPVVAHAARDPNAQHGPWETGLGAAADLGTGIATFGTGGYGLTLPLMAGYAASRLGRRIDQFGKDEALRNP